MISSPETLERAVGFISFVGTFGGGGYILYAKSERRAIDTRFDTQEKEAKVLKDALEEKTLALKTATDEKTITLKSALEEKTLALKLAVEEKMTTYQQTVANILTDQKEWLKRLNNDLEKTRANCWTKDQQMEFKVDIVSRLANIEHKIDELPQKVK